MAAGVESESPSRALEICSHNVDSGDDMVLSFALDFHFVSALNHIVDICLYGSQSHIHFASRRGPIFA